MLAVGEYFLFYLDQFIQRCPTRLDPLRPWVLSLLKIPEVTGKKNPLNVKPSAWRFEFFVDTVPCEQSKLAWMELLAAAARLS